MYLYYQTGGMCIPRYIYGHEYLHEKNMRMYIHMYIYILDREIGYPVTAESLLVRPAHVSECDVVIRGGGVGIYGLVGDVKQVKYSAQACWTYVSWIRAFGSKAEGLRAAVSS